MCMLMVVGVDRIPGQHSCHFSAFQKVLQAKTTKHVANGPVVMKLQALEVGEKSENQEKLQVVMVYSSRYHWSCSNSSQIIF